MIKHALIRNTALVFLGFAGMGLGSCKKEITERVDQAFSAVYKVNPGDWKRDNNNDPSYLFANFQVDEIDDVLNQNGAVIVYLSLDGGASYEALPEVIDAQDGSGTVAFGAFHQTGTVGVDIRPADGSGRPVSVPQPTVSGADILVKIVLVDATPLD